MKNLLLQSLLLLFVALVEIKARKKLVGYWGDNSSGSEKTLKFYCDLDIYETIIITQLAKNARGQNKGDLPTLSFANHCNYNPLLTEDFRYNLYKRCPYIEADIRHCQRKGIKLLLNVGAPGSEYIGWRSIKHANEDAFLWWNLFLGGDYDPKIRTFGSVRLDGINLHLVASRKDNLIAFVEAMRFLMTNRNTTKQYYLTMSPDCYTLDIQAAFVYDAVTKATDLFDAFYVNFYHSNCFLTSTDFLSYFNKWDKLLARKRPDFYIAISGNDVGSQRNFIEPEAVQRTLRKDDIMRRIKGIVLNNVGDDSRSLVRANRHYSFYIRSLLDDPTFDVLSITTTTTKKPPPQVENRNNQVSVRRINNRFIIYKGSGNSIRLNVVVFAAGIFIAFVVDFFFLS